MKYIYFFILFIFLAIYCNAENNDLKDPFEGVWGDFPGYGKINDFLIINKIGNDYLVITAFTDDDKSQKSIAKRLNHNILKIMIRGNQYTLKWDKDGDEEWLEMYIDPNVEEYPYFERIEKFSIDKF